MTNKKSRISMKQVKPKVKSENFGINPFRSGFTIDVISRNKKIKLENVDNVEIGEQLVSIGTTTSNETTYLLEKEHKTQLFAGEKQRLFIGEKLSPKSRDLFLWLAYDIDYSQEYVWINVPRYMKEFRVSLNTVKTAINELIDNAIINSIRVADNTFWINPRFFFKGSRPSKFKECVKIIK